MFEINLFSYFRKTLHLSYGMSVTAGVTDGATSCIEKFENTQIIVIKFFL